MAAPNWCPVCRAAIAVEPSPMGDAPCPSCGTLLWFYETPNGLACRKFADIAPLRDRLFVAIAAHFDMEVDEVVQAYAAHRSLGDDPLGADSLDVVELIMELEANFNLTLPTNAAEGIKTFRDLIDYLLRCQL